MSFFILYNMIKLNIIYYYLHNFSIKILFELFYLCLIYIIFIFKEIFKL